MKLRKKKNLIEPYNDEENIKDKEDELLSIYDEDNYPKDEDVEEVVIDEEDEPPKSREEIVVEDNLESKDEEPEEGLTTKQKKTIKVINIVFTILVILMILVSIDVISVSKFDKVPYFAIPVKTYKDGGTKVYYGLGYKVISYNQIQGRRDKEIGLWSLKYNTTAIDVKSVDLAIAFTNNQDESYKKYYKKFVRVTSTLQDKSSTGDTINIGYIDDEKKYSLNIVCTMANKKNVKKFEVGNKITTIGTITGYEYNAKTKVGTLYISNAFAEQ